MRAAAEGIYPAAPAQFITLLFEHGDAIAMRWAAMELLL
jgi:hypothetical protein